MPEHLEKDWNMQAGYRPLEGVKWLHQRLGNSSQSVSGPGKDSRAAPTHDLGTVQQGVCISSQMLTVRKTQSAEMLLGPWESP